jgi:hypothetical protein
MDTILFQFKSLVQTARTMEQKEYTCVVFYMYFLHSLLLLLLIFWVMFDSVLLKNWIIIYFDIICFIIK